ncbi:arginase family protein [Lentibacillus sp. N15]|uniref:arginase family protein n=1 Tax=Lentibacillus songyuanensis TaxID=3136161 RepID=UPI0031B9D730
MERHITVLDFDQTYSRQSFLHKSCRWIDLQEMSGTNLFCERDTLFHISQQLKQHTNPITLLGSGNYHYVSFLLLSQLQAPFTLILFDHHTDMLPSPNESLMSCGSWVYDSLQHLPFLKKIILIGVSNDWQQHVPSSVVEKVIAFSEKTLHQDSAALGTSIIQQIQTENVYISIDKDVLDPSEAITAWDHGTLRLNQLREIVHETMQQREVLGIDICGEYPVTPTNEYSKQTREAIRRNNAANHFILESIKETVHRF